MKDRFEDFGHLLRALKASALGVGAGTGRRRDPEVVALLFLDSWHLTPALRGRLVQEALERMAAEFQREQQAAAD
jgi:hypothetical protein